MEQNLLQVTCNCSAVVLCDFDAGFEPRCHQKDILCVCLLLLLLAVACCCY